MKLTWTVLLLSLTIAFAQQPPGHVLVQPGAIQWRGGGVAVMPANTHHYEGGKGLTVVALIAQGPFTTTMIK